MAMEKKEIRRAAALIIIAILLTIAATIFVYFAVFDVAVLRFDFQVGDYAGINADTDMLHFGTGYPGSYLERHLTIKADEDAFIRIKSTLDYVYPEKNSFVMYRGENKTIYLRVSIPDKAEKGLYEGKIAIFTKSL